MILNAEPGEKGNVYVYGVASSSELRAQVHGPENAGYLKGHGVPLHLDHHATCPQAKEWRQR